MSEKQENRAIEFHSKNVRRKNGKIGLGRREWRDARRLRRLCKGSFGNMNADAFNSRAVGTMCPELRDEVLEAASE